MRVKSTDFWHKLNATRQTKCKSLAYIAFNLPIVAFTLSGDRLIKYTACFFVLYVLLCDIPSVGIGTWSEIVLERNFAAHRLRQRVTALLGM